VSIILIIILLVLLFGGGGAYYGSRAGWGRPHYGGGLLSLVLLILLVLWFTGNMGGGLDMGLKVAMTAGAALHGLQRVVQLPPLFLDGVGAGWRPVVFAAVGRYACLRRPATSSTIPTATTAAPSTGGSGSVRCRSAVACTGPTSMTVSRVV
jgi:hypothetical protein